MKEYILKHKNHDVIIFVMDENKYNVLDIKKIINKERLPFGLMYENNLIQCGKQLESWIKGRGIADSRNDKNEIKLLFDVKDTCQINCQMHEKAIFKQSNLHEKAVFKRSNLHEKVGKNRQFNEMSTITLKMQKNTN